MRWIFYLLFSLNGIAFVFGFFVVLPQGDVQLVEPGPLAERAVAGQVLLLKEDRIGDTSEEPHGYAGPETFPGVIPIAESSYYGDVEELRPETKKCYRLGPFRDRVAADSFHAQVGIAGGSWKIESNAETSIKGYWVFLPAYETRQAAVAVLRELQDLGIESFVVSGGEYENAISLGTFKGQESASQIKERVISAGFAADIIEKRESVEEYWLYLEAMHASDQEMIEKSSNPSLSIAVFSCEMFAQDRIIP